MANKNFSVGVFFLGRLGDNKQDFFLWSAWIDMAYVASYKVVLICKSQNV